MALRLALLAQAFRRWRTVGSALVACSLLIAGGPSTLRSGGDGTLVASEPLDICMMPAPSERRAAMATAASPLALARGAFSMRGLQNAAAAGSAFVTPIRKLKDPYPSFAAVAVDTDRNEVVFTDESLFQVLVYDRLENTPSGAQASKPKRAIVGDKTDIEFQSGVYIDPKSGEIYAVNNDTRDTTVVFPAGANGNVAPLRAFKTPHGTFSIAVAEAHNEVLLTLQHDSALVVYRKDGGEKDDPLRFLQGDRTKLADPHGIAYDPKDDVIFIANFGSRHEVSADVKEHAGIPGGQRSAEHKNWPMGREWAVPGSGSVNPPSIVVHRRTAGGNEAPLRVIAGPATQFNWPTGLAFDPERRELYVANDMGPSILVFDATASGNVAPKRVIEGAATRLINPTGVAVDLKNKELWVANFGGHNGLVYDLAASGNTPPKRTIRNAPEGAPSLMIGNPGAVAYDTKREQILVPN